MEPPVGCAIFTAGNAFGSSSSLSRMCASAAAFDPTAYGSEPAEGSIRKNGTMVATTDSFPSTSASSIGCTTISAEAAPTGIVTLPGSS